MTFTDIYNLFKTSFASSSYYKKPSYEAVRGDTLMFAHFINKKAGLITLLFYVLNYFLFESSLFLASFALRLLLSIKYTITAITISGDAAITIISTH